MTSNDHEQGPPLHVWPLAACSSGGTAVPPEVDRITAQDLQRDYGVSGAALEDLQFIADDEGWTLGEAYWRIGWHETFARFVEDLRQAHPGSFAGAAIDIETGPRNAWIAFAGPVPVGIELDPRLADIEIDWRADRGFSEESLVAQVTTVHRAIREAGWPEVGTGPDMATGAIDVTIRRRPEDVGVTAGELTALLPEVARADNVRVVWVDHPIGGDD